MIQPEQSAIPIAIGTRQFLKPRSWSKGSMFVVVLALLFGYGPLRAQSEPIYKFFKGRVKSCNEQCYKAKGYEPYIDKVMHRRPPNSGRDFEINYDSLGKKLQKIELHQDGSNVFQTYSYTYDGFNQLAEIRLLDAQGALIKSTRYWNTLDSSGKLLGRFVDFSDREESVGYAYSYPKNGVTYEYVIPRSGDLRQLPSREFDSAGHVTKYWSYTEKWTLTGYAKLTYDSLGNKILEELFDKNDVNYLNYSWKFEGGHDPVRYEVCKAGSTTCESWTYKYEYDKMGNWIRRTEYRNGKLVYLTERKYTYW